MSRNKHFISAFEPFRKNRKLMLNNPEISGPLWFLSPTQAVFNFIGDSTALLDREGAGYTGRKSADEQYDETDIEYRWTTRDNRKGRHALVIRKSDGGSKYDTPTPATRPRAVLEGLCRMFRSFSMWDISKSCSKESLSLRR